MESSQLRLENPRLFVRAEQDRDILRRNVEFLHEIVDFAHDRFGFEFLIWKRLHRDGDTFFVSDQDLLVSSQVVMHELIGKL